MNLNPIRPNTWKAGNVGHNCPALFFYDSVFPSFLNLAHMF